MAAPTGPTSPRRRIKRGLLIALLLAVVGFLSRNVILGTPVETHRAVRGDLIQTVVASGRIMTPQRCDRIIELVDGRVVSDRPNANVIRRGAA